MLGGITHFYFYKIHNSYNPRTQSILLARQPRTALLPTLAHEYAHHVQYQTVVTMKKYRRPMACFEEGHARGIEAHIAQLYQKKECNEAFLWSSSMRTVEELQTVYLYLARKVNGEVKEGLLDKSLSAALGPNPFSRRPNHHALGHTLLLLYEARYGDRIYRDILQG